jgi:hypothetical protein
MGKQGKSVESKYLTLRGSIKLINLKPMNQETNETS